MTRNQAIEIARQRALNARESHGYLPVTEADAQTWMPHEWVIDAILWATMQCDLAAQQAEPSQTIYCAEKRKPGGCQLHNLHCGWPKCNESPQQAAQPVAPNIRAALQQAYLALEELDGPGYLIGGVMHHRISLLLPMLNKAIDSLADAAAQPQQAADVVLTDADMSDIARDAQIAYFMDKYSSFVMAYARSVEAAVLKKIGGAA